MPLDRKRDVPAAAPLLFFAVALTAAPFLVQPRATAWGLVCAAVLLMRLRQARGACCALLVVLAIALSMRASAVRLAERAALATLDNDRFVTVEAPLTGGWSMRNGSHHLRVDSFAVRDGAWRMHFGRPLLLHASFAPASPGMARRIIVQGSLRLSERGDVLLHVKSPRLLSYSGALSPWTPAGWNRLAMLHVDRLARGQPQLGTAAALVEALVLGHGERLSAETRDAYRRGGTYHFLVFSGLQVAFAAGFLALLARRRGRPRLGDWLLLAFALLAPPFAGASAAVTRACLAVGLFAVSRLLKRPTPSANLLFVSALIRLIAVPSDLVDVGFQLTYAGAGAALLVGKHRRLVRRLLQGAAAELALTPLTLFYFHQYAVGGPLLLALLAPLVVAMLALGVAVCATAAVVPPLAAALLEVVGRLDVVCMRLNDWSASWLHLSGFAMAPPAWLLAAVYASVVTLIAFAPKRLRATAIPLVLAIPLFYVAIRTAQLSDIATARLEMLDVGQGDAILLRDGRTTMLVDGGGRIDDERFGETTLLPLLVDRGVRRVDVIALSHAHPDHCGGLSAVIRFLPVGELAVSPRRFTGPCAQQLLEACREAQVPIRLVRQDGSRAVGPLLVQTLAPPLNFKRSPENNSSVVYRIRLGRRWALLTGDIERDAETRLADDRPERLAADILKVAHHGSRTSSTPALLGAVHPRIALISCGRRNLFGHPNAGVVDALRRRGATVVRTDRSGTIRLDISGRRILLTREIDTFR